MDRFFRFFLRLVAITAGFVTACVAAAAANLLLNGAVTADEARRLGTYGFDLPLALGVFGFASLIGHAALLPALPVILAGEVLRRRDWLFYAIAAGAIAALILAAGHAGALLLPFGTKRIAIDIVTGMIAGIVYWLVAGRGAGRWLPSEAERERALSEPGSSGS